MQESDLIKQIISGDENAFRAVFEQNRNKVINACYRFVNNKEVAEDLTQEVFVEVFKSISKFKGGAQLSTWIYRIAVTKSIDYLRAQKRKKRFAFLKSITGDDEMENQIAGNESESPEKEMESKDRLRLLNWALESLPENQRVAFTLCNYDEMSYKEISEVLGTTVSAVESLIHRARKNLEKKLYKYYEKII